MDRHSKAALREESLGGRLRLSPADRADRSRRIAARVVALDAFRRARTIALYSPLGAEVDPSEVGRAAVAAGIRLVFPRIDAGSRVLGFAACGMAELIPGPHRTLQPAASAPAVTPEAIDLVVVPGVAFDERCHRLGRGGGYYDATLAAFPATTLRVGLAFEPQIVREVPREAHDVPVDVVVTEARVLFRLPRPPGPGNSPA